MEKAIRNGKIYTAFEIAEDYEIEKAVRIDSANHRLRCPDPDCENPFVKYCHGEVKEPFFAHIEGRGCDYSDYDSGLEPGIRAMKRIVYDSFKRRGYNVEMDVKAVPHHYTHLLFSFGDARVALELANKNTTASRLENIRSKYIGTGIRLAWLVIGYPPEEIDEKHEFFAKRYMLNEKEMNDLVIISEAADKLSQYRPDPNIYEYNGNILRSTHYPYIFKLNATLDDLIVCADGYLGFASFSEKFDNMLRKKRNAFVNLIKKIQAEEQERERKSEEEARRRAEYKKQLAGKRQYSVEIKSGITYITIRDKMFRDEIFREMYEALFKQEKTCVSLENGNRLYLCESCRRVGVMDDFCKVGANLGGKTYFSLGYCNRCYG